MILNSVMIDQLFMHYFHYFSSASGGFAPRPSPELHPGPRWGTFVSRPPNLPNVKKFDNVIAIIIIIIIIFIIVGLHVVATLSLGLLIICAVDYRMYTVAPKESINLC